MGMLLPMRLCISLVLSFALWAAAAEGKPLGSPADNAHDLIEYDFSGVFTWGDVLTTLCDGGVCRLALPQTFYDMSSPFSVYEKTFKQCFSVLQSQAKANGWNLYMKGKTIHADVIEVVSVPYVSCLDTLVHVVPSNQLYANVRSDSIRCFKRDYLSLPALPESYRVSFYLVTSSSLDELGVSWSETFIKGTLHNNPHLIEGWTLYAVSEGDSSVEYRTIDVVIDTGATLHWGSQVKDETSLVTTSSYTSSNYEWRDYGLTLTIRRTDSTLNMDYELAQLDENNSVLEGSMGGSDSLFSWGVYNSYKVGEIGVPYLQRIPLLGALFKKTTISSNLSFFAIEVVPSYSKKFIFDSDSSIFNSEVDLNDFLLSH